MPMLELQNVRAGYGRLPVLFDINLSVEPGEWVSVVGANGSGRSTLLKTILGATAMSAGEVVFQGQRITNYSTHKRVGSGIALSPEGRRIFKNLTVRENLRSGANCIPRTQINAQLERIYGVFPKLEARADQRAGSCSGGEQQMLAIGRALMSRPKLLLVDELSLGLAPIIVSSLTESLRTLCQEEGLGIIVVDEVHVHQSVGQDRRLVLEKGRFAAQAEVETQGEAFAAAH